jgi:hypothetical protein
MFLQVYLSGKFRKKNPIEKNKKMKQKIGKLLQALLLLLPFYLSPTTYHMCCYNVGTISPLL